ncbi:hypothetical protein D9M72_654920 [compost metagenome]
MRAHHGLHGGSDLIDLRLRELGPPRILRTQLLVLREVAVLGLQRQDALLQFGTQRFPRQMLVGKQRVAAFTRQLLRVQQRAQTGVGLVRNV